jgi:hypothetical protein
MICRRLMPLLAAAGALLAVPARPDDLERGFRNPPVSAWPQVWWHWLAGNVSRPGITADLEAMKRVGIGGGTIANIPFAADGPAPFMTPAWREMTKHAVREADRLGLEVGCFNCEGWSSSGGPWVKAAEAMQALVWTEAQVQGGGHVVARLPQPTTRLGHYRDVALLAFPTPEAEHIRPVHDLRPAASTGSGTPVDGASLCDGDPGTFIATPFDGRRDGHLDLTFDRPVSACGFRLTPGPQWTRDDVELLVSDDGAGFRSVGRYPMPQSFLDIGVEWQTTASFAQVTARVFRFAFHLSQGRTFQADATANTVADLELTAEPGSRLIPDNTVVDLTVRMGADGSVQWDAPAGDWTLLRLGHTPIGKKNHPVTKWGEGLECDKLSREAVESHCRSFVNKVIADAGPLAGKTLAYSLIDSYECGDQNWTPALPDEFHRLRGYELRNWLPALTGRTLGDEATTRRFMDDFRRTVADLWNESYYAAFTRIVRRQGLKSSAEAYGNGGFDALRASGVSDMPMSEFWFGNLDDGGISRMAASAAHVYGRPIVGAEAFTSGDLWNFDPWSMKTQGDWIYAQGVNRYYFHSYAGQRWTDDRKPGWAWGNGIHLTRNLTWWEQGKAYFGYLGRCQYLLQAGKPVADILSYAGEDGYSFNSEGRALRTAPEGYALDGVDRDMLLQGLRVVGWRIVAPSGATYRILVLPNERAMSPRVLRRIADLVRQGAVVVGPRPSRAFGLAGFPRADDEVIGLAAKLWDGLDGKATICNRVGKGRIYWTGDAVRVQPALDDVRLRPDCAIRTDDTTRMLWLHRRVGGAEVYFITNQEPLSARATCTFRVAGLLPEVWDAETGAVRVAPVWRTEPGGLTAVDLRFGPGQALFVVFRKRAQAVDRLVRLEWRPASPEAARRHTLDINRALYAASDGFGAPQDLTARVAAQVRGGAIKLDATNTLAGGDPAPFHVKELRVEYTYDGRPGSVTVRENGVLRIPAVQADAESPTYDVVAGTGTPVLTSWQPAEVAAAYASGKVVRRALPGAETAQVAGPWKVTFATRWGGPGRVAFDNLTDWTTRPEEGIRHFSGTAAYETTFQAPAAWVASKKVVTLDLGSLKNLAEVSLNGHALGVIWRPPWRVDVSSALKPGANRLTVRVTNLWQNRLIGDAALPEAKRVATVTHNPYRSDSPLAESGLLGPVTLRAASPTTLR